MARVIMSMLAGDVLESGCKGTDRLARAGVSEQHYQVDIRVHQVVERIALLDVAGIYAPDLVLFILVVRDALEGHFGRRVILYPRFKILAFDMNTVVDIQLPAKVSADPPEFMVAPFSGLHHLQIVPEVRGYRMVAGREHVGVLEQDLVVLIILGLDVSFLDTQRRIAHIDVFSHKNDFGIRQPLLTKLASCRDYLPVSLVVEQVLGQRKAERLHLIEELAGGRAAGRLYHRRTIPQEFLVAIKDVLDASGHLPCVVR